MMDSNVFCRSPVFAVKATWIYYILVLFPPLLAVVIVFFLVPLNIGFRLGIIAFIGGSTLYYYRLHIQQSLSKSVIEIRQNVEKNWVLKTSKGIQKQVIIQPSSFISPYLIILNFKSLDNKNYSSLFVKGSLPDNDFRRLRVQVKVDRSV